MEIDLEPLLRGETAQLPFSLEAYLDGSFPDSGITFPEPIRVSGIITNQAGYLRISLEASYVYETVCARCLAPIRNSCTLPLEKGVASSASLGDQENDDYLTYTDRVLSLDEALADLLFLNLPYRHLCREDCRGLCPVCGKNKNKEDCNCCTKTIDPRLAVLGQLLTDQDE